MSTLSRFLKNNKKQKENTKYKATTSLVDDKGVALDWVIKPITTKENNKLRDSCTIEVPHKSGMYRQKFDANKYLVKLICASVVEPNLESSELQDSYGVMKSEDLIMEMINNPAEYQDFAMFIQEFNGFEKETLEDKVEEVKN